MDAMLYASLSIKQNNGDTVIDLIPAFYPLSQSHFKHRKTASHVYKILEKLIKRTPFEV